MRSRVRDERLRRGMSQAEMAKALDVSRQTVISIEAGRYSPSLPLAFRIARLFGSTVDEMFCPEEADDEDCRPFDMARATADDHG
jgi:putative transcriptional regulator